MQIAPDLKEKLLHASAFIFDMDGTVVDLEKLNFTSFQVTIKQELDLDLTNEDYQTHISGRGSLNGLSSYLTSYNLDEEMAVQLQNIYRERKRKQLLDSFEDVVKVKEGVIPLLRSLKSRGCGLCLATATGKEFTEIIVQKAKLDMFDNVLTRADVVRIKPDPDIFVLAMEKLRSSPEESIIFEDSINGIRAAKNAGIYCVGFLTPELNDDFVREADTVITSYTPLISELSQECPS